jgi:hypothetical protein
VSSTPASLPRLQQGSAVSHTAIVENKRLGHGLALVEAQQDLRHTTKVMTNSEKTVYRKRTRMVSTPLPVLSNALNS